MNAIGWLALLLMATVIFGRNATVAKRRVGATLTYGVGVGILLGAYIGFTDSVAADVIGLSCMAVGAFALRRMDMRGRVPR